MENHGIYQIICTTDGKYYIGSSNNLLLRRKTHFTSLKYNRHLNYKLQNAWKEYGEKSFIFLIIENNIPKEKLLAVEQSYLNKAKLHKEQSLNLCFKTPTHKTALV